MPLSELRAYRGTNPRPDDFDAYWDRALTDLDRVMSDPGFAPVFRPARYSVPGYRFYDVTFGGVGGARIHAKCLLPGDGSPAHRGPRPAVLKYHGYSGYSGDWSRLLPLCAAGAAVFAMDVRGQGGASSDPGGTPGNTLHGHIVRGLAGEPEDLFYRGVFLDSVALARIAMDHDEVDPTRVASYGGSQGGALAIASAALEPRISRVFSVYPFLSDYRRVWDMDIGGWPYQEIRDHFRQFDPRHERVEEVFTRLGYIDIHHLSPRVRAEAIMVTGLMDDICPPSTQFAAFNALRTTKRHVIYPDFSHEQIPEEEDLALRFVCRLDD